MTPVRIRPAVLDERPALERLIARSARGLTDPGYSADDVEALIAHVFGVDTELIEDGTYFVAELGGELAGCGGWSRRRTLFGGDRFVDRDSGFLDPRIEAARIRAFFVDPRFARRGVATALLCACEREARAAGFPALELMATLPGVPFYGALSFSPTEQILATAGPRSVRLVAMRRNVAPAHGS